MNPATFEKLASVKLPTTVDTAGVCEIVEELEGQKPSEETVRRWPLRYKLIGRMRRYAVDDVVAFAKKRFEESPVRVARPPKPRRRAARVAKAEAADEARCAPTNDLSPVST